MTRPPLILRLNPARKRLAKCAASMSDKDAAPSERGDAFLSIFSRRGSSEDHHPNLFGSMAELAAGNTGTKVVKDTDSIVLEGVWQVVVSLGHGTDEDGDTFVRVQRPR